MIISIGEKTNILRTIGLIGYNTSGKTSFIHAIRNVYNFINFPYRKSKDNIGKIKEILKNKVSNNDEITALLEYMNTLNLYGQNVNRQNDDSKIVLEIYIPPAKNHKDGIYTYTLVFDKNQSEIGVKIEKLEYRKKYCDSKNIQFFLLRKRYRKRSRSCNFIQEQYKCKS